jgi:diacylglycerol kinase (ATP)
MQERAKKILIFYNPISGRGQSKSVAADFAEKLKGKNYPILLMESKRSSDEYLQILSEITDSSLIIVVGGDGTLLNMLPLLATSKVPVFMIPSGNESLFAQIYGMNKSFAQLSNALENGEVLQQYYGLISTTTPNNKTTSTVPFYIMASMGLDSLTVRNIGKRSTPINDFTYIKYGLKALLTLHHPLVSITVDGSTILEKEQGYFIVANSASYAHNLQLVPQASPSERRLDLGFLPNANILHELKKSYWMARYQSAKLPMQYYSGEKIEITLHSPDYPLQVDGEYFGLKEISAGSKVTFSLAETPINVLCP